MPVITRGNTARMLQEGLRKIFGQEYNEHKQQYINLFTLETSKKAFEQDQQFEGFGLAPEKPEGEGISYESQQEGFSPKYKHLVYGKGFIITEEALEDNLYGVFKKQARALGFSMRQTKENVAANIYNRGFNPAFVMVGGDGQPLFSENHINGPTNSGVFSNVLAIPAAFSETSLETLLIQIRKATDTKALRIAVMPERLILPVDLAFEAERVLKSVQQNDTANNAINAIKSMGAVPAHASNNYLTSSTAWFIKTNVMEGMTCFKRRAVKFERDLDFGTSNTRFKSTERYSFGWSDARGIYGSAGI